MCIAEFFRSIRFPPSNADCSSFGFPLKWVHHANGFGNKNYCIEPNLRQREFYLPGPPQTPHRTQYCRFLRTRCVFVPIYKTRYNVTPSIFFLFQPFSPSAAECSFLSFPCIRIKESQAESTAVSSLMGWRCCMQVHLQTGG